MMKFNSNKSYPRLNKNSWNNISRKYRIRLYIIVSRYSYRKLIRKNWRLKSKPILKYLNKNKMRILELIDSLKKIYLSSRRRK